MQKAKKGIFKIMAEEKFIEAVITFLASGKIHSDRFVEKINVHLS